jgi:molybdopterin molybdotransferase
VQSKELIMISYKNAKEIITRSGQKFSASVEKRDLLQAQGCIVAQDIFSSISVPAFDNSAMDGFAVRSQDLLNASVTNPVILKKRGMIAAGDSAGTRVEDECCVPIMTGAALPDGADAIVPIERIIEQGEGVVFLS